MLRVLFDFVVEKTGDRPGVHQSPLVETLGNVPSVPGLLGLKLRESKNARKPDALLGLVRILPSEHSQIRRSRTSLSRRPDVSWRSILIPSLTSAWQREFVWESEAKHEPEFR